MYVTLKMPQPRDVAHVRCVSTMWKCKRTRNSLKQQKKQAKLARMKKKHTHKPPPAPKKMANDKRQTPRVVIEPHTNTRALRALEATLMRV